MKPMTYTYCLIREEIKRRKEGGKQNLFWTEDKLTCTAEHIIQQGKKVLRSPNQVLRDYVGRVKMAERQYTPPEEENESTYHHLTEAAKKAFDLEFERLFGKTEWAQIQEHWSQIPLLTLFGPLDQYVQGLGEEGKFKFRIQQPRAEDRELHLYKDPRDAVVYLKATAKKFPITNIEDMSNLPPEIHGPVEILYKLTDNGFEFQSYSTNSPLVAAIVRGDSFIRLTDDETLSSEDIFIKRVQEEANKIKSIRPQAATEPDLTNEKAEAELRDAQELLLQLDPTPAMLNLTDVLSDEDSKELARASSSVAVISTLRNHPLSEHDAKLDVLDVSKEEQKSELDLPPDEPWVAPCIAACEEYIAHLKKLGLDKLKESNEKIIQEGINKYKAMTSILATLKDKTTPVEKLRNFCQSLAKKDDILRRRRDKWYHTFCKAIATAFIDGLTLGGLLLLGKWLAGYRRFFGEKATHGSALIEELKKMIPAARVFSRDDLSPALTQYIESKLCIPVSEQEGLTKITGDIHRDTTINGMKLTKERYQDIPCFKAFLCSQGLSETMANNFLAFYTQDMMRVTSGIVDFAGGNFYQPTQEKCTKHIHADANGMYIDLYVIGHESDHDDPRIPIGNDFPMSSRFRLTEAGWKLDSMGISGNKKILDQINAITEHAVHRWAGLPGPIPENNERINTLVKHCQDYQTYSEQWGVGDQADRTAALRAMRAILYDTKKQSSEKLADFKKAFNTHRDRDVLALETEGKEFFRLLKKELPDLEAKPSQRLIR